MSTVRGMIELDGIPYNIIPNSWSDDDIVDFSPRASLPGGGFIYSDMSLYQPIPFLDWSHGFGFIWHTDEAGYMYSDGYIDTRHSGLVTLFTESISKDTNANTKEGGVIFPVDNYLYTYGEAGVRRYNTSDGDPDNWAFEDVPWSRVYYDVTTKGEGTGAGANTVSHDPGVIENALVTLILFTDADVTITVEPTYGGTTMTKLYDKEETGAHDRVYLYGLCLGDIDGTAKDVVFTLSGASDWVACITTWENAHQTLATAIPDAKMQYTTSAPAGVLVPFTHTLVDGAIPVHALYQEDNTNVVSLAAGDDDDGSTIILTETDPNATTHSYTVLRGNPVAGDLSYVSGFANASGNEVYVQIGFVIVPTSSSIEINTMYTNGTNLFIFPEGMRPRYSGAVSATPSALDWTITGSNARSEDYAWATTFGGYTFCGKENSPYVYRSDDVALISLAGDPDDDTTEIAVGAGNEGTKAGVPFLDNLYATKTDGIWTLDTANNLATPKLNYAAEKLSTNFRSAISDGSFLYYSVRNKMYRWTGSTITDITPSRLDDDFPYTVLGNFDNFFHFEEWLFYTARTSEDTHTEAIFAYDGVGHHKLAEPITDGDGSITMMLFDPVNSRLWFHVSKDASETTYYIPFRTNSPYAYANFPTTGTNQIVSSRIDAGFRRIEKSVPFLWIETDDCDLDSYIRVKYSLDGATWVTWEDVKENGVQKLDFPGGALSQEANYLQIAFEFITTDLLVTPVLEGATLMVMLRPEVLYGYSFDIPVSAGMRTGGFEDRRTASEIKRDLRATRNSKSPVTLITPDGNEVKGYVASISGRLVELNEDMEDGIGQAQIESIITVSFVETLTIGEFDATEN